jgi:acetyl esterase
VPLHPQVKALLERVAQSPLPQYHTVPAFVARRIYRETRAVTSPPAPEISGLRVLVTPKPEVVLRAYRPAGAGKDELLPALVYYHGGGWVIGDIDTHDVLCRQLANAARCAVFSVDYRLAPEYPFPAAVEDSVAAAAYVAREAKALGVDPKRIAVGGDSAGGNLATVVALHARDNGGPALCFQLLIYPGTDQRAGHASHQRNGDGYLLTRHTIKFFQDSYLPRAEDKLDWRASPLLAKSLKGLPPAYVITAGYDPLIDEGREYAERMKKEGVAVAYREYPDMVHGFLLFGAVLDTANEAVADCAKALRGAFA